jgi:para-aminobenzoate synthetase component 1
MKKPVVCSIKDAHASGLFFNIKGETNSRDRGRETSIIPPSILNRYPVSEKKYSEAYQIVQDNLHGGNTYLLNLTFSTRIEISSSLEQIFIAASAPYKLFFEDRFTVFSPECFIRIAGGKIYSYPMKGTIDASIPDAEKIILDDKKEFWEHNTIVDLIRNDLSIVSERVEVNRFRFIDRIVTPEKVLLQVSSEISGVLPTGWKMNLGDLLFKLLPAGSISGAPKKKTVEIIREAEGEDRGYYTGIFGVFNGEDLDSAVCIRYIEKNGDDYYFRSGGGITANSNKVSEYQELMDKVNVPYTS